MRRPMSRSQPRSRLPDSNAAHRASPQQRFWKLYQRVEWHDPLQRWHPGRQCHGRSCRVPHDYDSRGEQDGQCNRFRFGERRERHESPYTEILPITDFTINPSVLTPNINAGELAVINVTLTPDQTLGYNSTLTMSQSASPSMVTSPSPTFTIQPVVLSGTSQQLTVLNIQICTPADQYGAALSVARRSTQPGCRSVG